MNRGHLTYTNFHHVDGRDRAGGRLFTSQPTAVGRVARLRLLRIATARSELSACLSRLLEFRLILLVGTDVCGPLTDLGAADPARDTSHSAPASASSCCGRGLKSRSVPECLGRRDAPHVRCLNAGLPDFRALRPILVPGARVEIAEFLVSHAVHLGEHLDDVAVGVAMID